MRLHTQLFLLAGEYLAKSLQEIAFDTILKTLQMIFDTNDMPGPEESEALIDFIELVYNIDMLSMLTKGRPADTTQIDCSNSSLIWKVDIRALVALFVSCFDERLQQYPAFRKLLRETAHLGADVIEWHYINPEVSIDKSSGC